MKHDFERDPIETYIDGEWVKARGTTLGADNGIGMAAAMAVLADKELKHGRIQALFTVDEETGLTGAHSQPGVASLVITTFPVLSTFTSRFCSLAKFNKNSRIRSSFFEGRGTPVIASK